MEKVSIIGAGFVGSTAAYAMLVQGIASTIALIDINKEKAHGEALDLEHGLSFVEDSKIIFGDSYSLLEGSDVVVICAGVGQKPGETRLELIEKNSAIFKSIVPNIVKHAPNTVIVVVTNPVDILTYLTIKYSGLPKERVFGTGTTLDTSRFRHYLGEHFSVSSKSIHAYILGEHGDSEFPALSRAMIAGTPLAECDWYSDEAAQRCFQQTRNAAYEIINRKGATYYAIGLAISRIVRSILNDEKRVYPVSTLLTNYYEEGNICLSIPCAIGRGGITRRFQLALNKDEQAALHRSAAIVRASLKGF